MSILLPPTTKRILVAVKRVLRDKTSVTMTKGKQFDKQFLSVVRQSLGCDMPTPLLHEELEFLCRHEFIDCIVKNDEYGEGTKHYVGDPS